MTTPLLTTKLFVPARRANRVPRPQLVERLDDGLRLDRRLTLISAPAGFGKTMLLSEWAVEAGRPIAWLNLDEGDNDPARFWVYVIGALRTVKPDFGEAALQAIQSPQAPALNALLIHLINEVAAVDQAVMLVLDDYHEITVPVIHEGVSFLLEHCPPQFHLAIATRADPPLQLARLRALGQMTEIRQADLRMSRAEVRSFLERTMGLQLAATDVAALGRRTEGWVAGLQLAALVLQGVAAAQGPDEITRLVADLTGTDRFVLDYLAEEVLRRQTEEDQHFLIHTSILDRLCGSLCDAVLDSDRAGLGREMLEKLEAANLFIVPLDHQRRWYRYHRLFADFLRSRLQQNHPERIPGLHCRAAAWYEITGQIAAAVEHALAGRDLSLAADLIERATQPALMQGEVDTLLHWIARLPDALVRSRPGLSICYAEALVVACQLDGVERYLDDAERGIDPHSASPAARRTLGQIAAMRAYLAFFTGDAAQADELSHRADALLAAEDPFLRSITKWLIGLTQTLGGNATLAQVSLAESVRLSQAGGGPLAGILSIYVYAYVEFLRGHPKQAERMYRQGEQLALASCAGPAPPALALIYQGLGDVLREWNDLEQAESCLERSVELAQQWGNAEVLVDTYALMARVKQAQGHSDQADQAIRRAWQFIEDGRVAQMTGRLVEAYWTRLRVAQGDIDGALPWAQAEMSQAQGGGWTTLFLHWIERATLVRLLVAQGRCGAALEMAEGLLKSAEAGDWMGIVIELLTLQSLALYGLGNADAALTALQRALRLGCAEGYVRVFVDCGAPVAGLLREMLQRPAGDGALRSYARSLLAALSPAERTELPHLPAPAGALPEPLSERESEVLGLIAAGLTNREISERLFIAYSTVKTHVNSIYRKLEVSSRVQAVTRATELDLV